jgi:uncharacterized protein (DUF433 family)
MEIWSKHIVINPEIRFGKPTIIGTQITVADILSWLASGISNEAILEDFLQLTKDSIFAPLSFAVNRESSRNILAV